MSEGGYQPVFTEAARFPMHDGGAPPSKTKKRGERKAEFTARGRKRGSLPFPELREF
jgi:hypothetical protein